MDSSALVFDISSDEEPPALGDSKVYEDDYDWLTELLGTVEKKETPDVKGGDVVDAKGGDDDDDDEVVVVGEYIPPKSKSKSRPLKAASGDGGGCGGADDDNDCVVLDGDPDKPAAVADDQASDDGDDVLVVGQTGQIACRDYPHSRHLCAKFPFTSTPHGDHCQLCHCYVCDSLAPCAHWGIGVSPIDHCHANDKEEMWKTQRELFRIGKDLAVSKGSEVPLPVTVPQNNEASLNLSPLAPNTLPQNQISRPAAIRACTSTRLSIPNIIRQSRHQHSVSIQGRNGHLPRAVSQQPLGVRNYYMRRDRGPYLSNFGQNNAHPGTTVRRPAVARRSVGMNQSVYGSSNNMNFVPVARFKAINAPVQNTMSNQNSNGSLDVLAETVSESYSYPNSHSNLGGVVVDKVSSGLEVSTTLSRPKVSTTLIRPEVSSQPIPQSNGGQSICQMRNQGHNGSDWRFTDIDASWMNNPSQSDGLAVDNQLQGTGANNEPSIVNECGSQFYGSVNSQFQYTDHDFGSWFLNNAVPVASEGCMSGDMNTFSSEPSAVDAGMMYFDFETSWNGLTRT
ncbi:hypothetical protein Tsubulata_047443 [Turnera subulata]|uniref:RPM1 interacting protein 13 n=1 Tax=Turnera subulata TaxID=218843 RepID=A0A9Q0J3K1_9ROSI|nr:hypothetical protein Tsubulata_047443 [Turnera subulata]